MMVRIRRIGMSQWKIIKHTMLLLVQLVWEIFIKKMLLKKDSESTLNVLFKTPKMRKLIATWAFPFEVLETGINDENEEVITLRDNESGEIYKLINGNFYDEKHNLLAVRADYDILNSNGSLKESDKSQKALTRGDKETVQKFY